MKKLVIIDEYLVGKHGHFYEYNSAAKKAFESKGVAVRIYANKKLEKEIEQEIGAVPHFDIEPEKKAIDKIPVIGRITSRISYRIGYMRAITEILKKEQGPGTCFFFEFVVWSSLLPITLCLRKTRVNAVLMLRFSVTQHSGTSPRVNKLVNRLFDYCIKVLTRNGYALATDSETIAEEIHAKYKIPVTVLPIPHLDAGHGGQHAVTEQPKEKIICYIPGVLAKHKGGDFLLDVLERMSATDHPLNDKFVLVTQFNDRFYDKAANEAIKERLRNTKTEVVFLSTLSSEDYYKQFMEADIIWAVYDEVSGFYYRTSGVMSEAIAFEKPFFTTKDTWMELQAKKYDTGIVIEYGNVDAFIEKLNDMVNHYPAHKKRAIEAGPAWLNFHSKENFYRTLTGAAQLP